MDAGNDLNEVNRRQTLFALKSFGKMTELFSKIDECIAVLDAGKWPVYMHAGGITFGTLVNATVDYFDLDVIPVATGFALFEKPPGTPRVKAVNPAIKALVINHMWMAMPTSELAENIPTIVVGRDFAEMLNKDSSNPAFMDYSVTAENLEAAVKFAGRIAQTDKIMIFDGSFGHINLSPSMAKFLMEKAPEVSRNVDETLMPKWLRQRGFA